MVGGVLRGCVGWSLVELGVYASLRTISQAARRDGFRNEKTCCKRSANLQEFKNLPKRFHGLPRGISINTSRISPALIEPRPTGANMCTINERDAYELFCKCQKCPQTKQNTMIIAMFLEIASHIAPIARNVIACHIGRRV